MIPNSSAQQVDVRPLPFGLAIDDILHYDYELVHMHQTSAYFFALALREGFVSPHGNTHHSACAQGFRDSAVPTTWRMSRIKEVKRLDKL